MLMMDRITEISTDGGEFGKGHIVGELDITPDLWFFGCHFVGDPVVPGCLGLDAMWQIVGYWLGWSGSPGKGRAVGVGEVKFSGHVMPDVKRVRYRVDMHKVRRSKLALGIANGRVFADDSCVYVANDLRVGLIRPVTFLTAELPGMTIGAPIHPLDHPIWTALTTRQQALAEGGALARRYPPAIAPFADMADMSPQSFAALGALMSGSEIAVLFTPDPVTPPAEFKILLAETGEQMIGTPAESSIAGVEIVTLGADDVPAMLALTELTKPGPFSARTHELGTFLGIRIDGQLVAMAGERMKPANYTEITAVCVHPSHRGRGYGQVLLAAISRQILARGEIPFLHVFSSNESAIALYRRQGMEIRRRLHVTVLQKRT